MPLFPHALPIRAALHCSDAGQVLGAGLNPVDWKMAQHGFNVSTTPLVLGCDVAGRVKSIGANVHNCKVGDEIMSFTPLGTPGCGGFAELCLVRDDQICHKPPSLAFEEAAALPVAVATALLALNLNFKLPTLPNKVGDGRKCRGWCSGKGFSYGRPCRSQVS